MSTSVLIVGGGSAGCVLATRLSEDPDKEVLLLEAGPDYESFDATPDDIRASAYAPMSHDWGYSSEPDVRGNSVVIPRGRVIGGSSATNFCFAMRARPADHDRWVELGNPGWSFDDVLPLYKAMERYDEGEDRWHGRTGPYRITRPDEATLAPHPAAFAQAATARGYRPVTDFNAPTDEIGFGLVSLSQADGVRQSTALTYLNPVRERPNLTVRGDALVDRVLFDGRRAVGVRLASGEELEADSVIHTTGSYNTPPILMRSGVGPAGHLAEHGIDLVADRPGVGQNLTEHPVMWNIYAAQPPGRDVEAMFQMAMTVRSAPDVRDYDLHILPTSAIPTEEMPPTAWVEPMAEHPTGWDFIFFVSCVQPLSRGSVTLRSTDPGDSPAIDLGLYTHPEDVRRVAHGVRLARELAATSPLAELLGEERAPGVTAQGDDLERAIERSPSHYHHPVSTCRMGDASDPTAVVSARCDVHGVDGLSVVDASIMPVTPRVPTNPATIVLAERAAAMMGEQALQTAHESKRG